MKLLSLAAALTFSVLAGGAGDADAASRQNVPGGIGTGTCGYLEDGGYSCNEVVRSYSRDFMGVVTVKCPKPGTRMLTQSFEPNSSELKIRNFAEEPPNQASGFGFNVTVINNSHTQSHSARLSYTCASDEEYEVYKKFSIREAMPKESGIDSPGIYDFNLYCPSSHPVYKRAEVRVNTPDADVHSDIIPIDVAGTKGAEFANTNGSRFRVSASASAYCRRAS